MPSSSPDRLSLTGAPFVLLDDARQRDAAPARLLRDPVDILTADRIADVSDVLTAAGRAAAMGQFVAGYLTYDAAPAFASVRRGGSEQDGVAGGDPLVWFGVFGGAERIAPGDVPALLPDPDAAWLGRMRPMVDFPAYDQAIGRVLEYIRAGDIYQANLTFAAEVAVMGDPLAAYARLRGAARAGYGGFIWTGERAIASLSPELFFHLSDHQLMARPMKGTAARAANPEQDRLAAQQLATDPKQRAENLMIVDLLRNDLSRVCAAGSVKVPDLFRVESFPTIHQLVSDVSARLSAGKTVVDVLHAAFPCGSITGAPKIRAMEIITEAETGRRGLYTGSIGFIAPDGTAAFNVAIRTLVFPPHRPLPGQAIQARLGLGSGIVADSQPVDEWRECLAKGAFVAAAETAFDLMETMYFDPMDGIRRLDGHLARLKASAAAFDFPFDRHGARNNLQSVTFRLREPARVRMRLAPSGALAIEVSPMPQRGDAPVRAAPCLCPLTREDFRLAHKTSLRGAYDQARQDNAAEEVVFVDADGLVTEGSWSNIFVRRGDRLLTPPAHLGLLPGVLRAELLASGAAQEAQLTLDDLADGFFLGNSLRGLVAAQLVEHPA